MIALARDLRARAIARSGMVRVTQGNQQTHYRYSLASGCYILALAFVMVFGHGQSKNVTAKRVYDKLSSLEELVNKLIVHFNIVFM